jgi:hypothetical protein
MTFREYLASRPAWCWPHDIWHHVTCRLSDWYWPRFGRALDRVSTRRQRKAAFLAGLDGGGRGLLVHLVEYSIGEEVRDLRTGGLTYRPTRADRARAAELEAIVRWAG